MRVDDLTTTDDSIPDLVTKYDGPTTLGVDRIMRGVSTSAVSRLFFKPEKGKTNL
jgi:hypothetical protein